MACCRFADTEDYDCVHCGFRIRHDPDRQWVHSTGPQAGWMTCRHVLVGDQFYAHPASTPCPPRCPPVR